MIPYLIDKFLDRCIQLVRYKQEVNKNLYDTYVVPAYNQFELVHNNYLETFKNYRQLIKSADETTDIESTLLDKIKEDSIFTENQRTKLGELSELSKKQNIEKFVFTISEYMWDAPNTLNYNTNMPRGMLTIELERIFGSPPKIDERKKSEALHILDIKVKDLQHEYSIVTREYLQLKKDLIMK